MSFTQEDVYRIVKQHGPIIANDIKKRLQAPDSTLINVYLSHLKEQEKIKFTYVKLGSSKFAYTPEQKDALENLQQHLNEKDQKTANKLKEQQVLRAQTQDPLTRVSLKEIKDFAIPIQVQQHEEKELFYRYYKTTPTQAQEKIKEILNITTQPKQQETTTKETSSPTKESSPTHNSEKNNSDTTTQQEQAQRNSKEKSTQESNNTQVQEEKQQSLIQTEIDAESKLAQQIVEYCKQQEITILAFEEIRKNSEIDMQVQLPTPIGTIQFYAKAKSKKTSNDGDLAAAILSANNKMLPALYFTTGTVTNKAKQNPELQKITVVELGS